MDPESGVEYVKYLEPLGEVLFGCVSKEKWANM
jgi:Fe-S cluster biosynthesis and repair protein YggX